MQQNNLNLDLEKTTGMKCDKCENEIFNSSFLLRKVSRFVTGTNNDAIVPIPVFSCNNCNHVNEEFIPQMLRNQYTDFEEISNEQK